MSNICLKINILRERVLMSSLSTELYIIRPPGASHLKCCIKTHHFINVYYMGIQMHWGAISLYMRSLQVLLHSCSVRIYTIKKTFLAQLMTWGVHLVSHSGPVTINSILLYNVLYCIVSIHLYSASYCTMYRIVLYLYIYIAHLIVQCIVLCCIVSIHLYSASQSTMYCIILYCIYTFIQRFLQCTPIRSASSARDPERRE